ncbi:MAG: hypothetical protein ACKOYC_11175 [Bacteroidota bacterium]
MDDLKIVLYIVGAIIWLLYKNYQKVSEQSKTRDISKPYEEEAVPVPSPSVTKPKPQPARSSPRPTPIRTPKSTEFQRNYAANRAAKQQSQVVPVEGGSTKPSQNVRFEEPDAPETSWNNPIAEEIRNADFRKAFVLSEVLQRPYN